MRKLLVLTLVIAFATMPLGYCASNNWGNTDTYRLLGKVVPSYLISTGTEVTGASKTMASPTTIIPATGYDVVTITLNTGVGTVNTLAAGTVGKILVIVAGTVTGSDTVVITPAQCTGFSTVTLATAKQTATFLYTGTTLGWILLGTSGAPTVA